MKSLKSAIGAILLLATLGCATTFTSNLEDAKFALNKRDYETAVSKASAALNADPTNIEAARILASAYFGRSGLDFLDLASGLVDLQNNPETNFQQIANVLPDTAEMADVREAIETLQTLPGITADSISDEDLADAAFDLGIMQIVEHFALGVYDSGFKTGTLDVTGISDQDRDNVLSDLLNFDNRLIGSGVSETEGFIEQVRQTFCILEPLSAGEGFTTGEYQAFVGCQLSDDPATFDTAAVAPSVADCDQINPDTQSASVQSCYTRDTSL